MTFEGSIGDSVHLIYHGTDAIWFYEKFNLNPIHPPIKFGEIISIRNMQLEHSGNYFCYANYSEKPGKFFGKINC